MKKNIYIFFVVSVFVVLFGCNQNTMKEQEQILSGGVVTSTTYQTEKELFLQGKLLSSLFITGIYYPIIVSGDTLLYSGIFSIAIPQEMDTWEYISQYDILTQTYTEQIIFADILDKNHMTLSIRKIVGPDSLLSEKILCTSTSIEGVVSRSEKIVDRQGKDIFINISLLKTSGADIQPRNIQESQFCFVNSGMIYNFSLSDTNQSYIQPILQSLIFF